MEQTLKMMTTLITEESSTMSLEELAEKYRLELNPIYLATAFERIYYQAINLSLKYYMLSSEDVSSYTLEILDYCLINYDTENGAKFITYFSTFLKNRFREVAQSLMTQKRKTIFISNSYEDMVDNGFDLSVNHERDIESICYDLKGMGIDDNLIYYSIYLMKGYTNTEISELMGVSVMTLCNYRKKLREEFALHAL